MATPEEAVSNASAKFAVIEGSMQKAIDNLNKMPKDFKDVAGGGPLEIQEGAKQFGSIEAAMYSAEAQALAGEVAVAMAHVIDFHQRCTDRAISIGIDPPGTLGGGGR